MADTRKRQDDPRDPARRPPLPHGVEATPLQGPEHYRIEHGLRVIDVQVPQIGHLFNRLDPSPPATKDLDSQLDRYIRDAVDEIGGPEKAKIVFHLPAEQLKHVHDTGLTDAVHNYFAYRCWAETVRLKQMRRRGYISFLIALAFLMGCLFVRSLLEDVPGAAADIAAEGLLIAGWVAMWRPLELFLYDWWPVWREARLYRELQKVTVDWRAAPAGTL
ncbi:MAG: hypothetical protein AB7E79_01770 [Rhodospirillaceae bacterium]